MPKKVTAAFLAIFAILVVSPGLMNAAEDPFGDMPPPMGDEDPFGAPPGGDPFGDDLGGDPFAPPPPAGDDMMMAPPGDDFMAPPPGDDFGMPPGDDMMMPPSGGDDLGMPPMGDDFGAPPPGDDFGMPPGDDFGMPPGDDFGMPPGGDDLLAPPPGADMMMPPMDEGAMLPPPQDPMAPSAAPAPSSGDDSYIVVNGDSLWRISGKSRIYSDNFRWPLLYIFNKNRIKDPDLIQPGWKLTVKRNLPNDEIQSAIQKAKDTPRYVPHTVERKRLPIDY